MRGGRKRVTYTRETQTVNGGVKGQRAIGDQGQGKYDAQLVRNNAEDVDDHSLSLSKRRRRLVVGRLGERRICMPALSSYFVPGTGVSQTRVVVTSAGRAIS